MNGGALGAYHISAPWGDSLTAGMFGSNAVAWGSEPADSVFASMLEDPEPFGFPGADETAQARGSCEEKCAGLPTIAYIACFTKCAGKPPRMGTISDLAQTGAIFLVGVGLVLIGALALTK